MNISGFNSGVYLTQSLNTKKSNIVPQYNKSFGCREDSPIVKYRTNCMLAFMAVLCACIQGIVCNVKKIGESGIYERVTSKDLGTAVKGALNDCQKTVLPAYNKLDKIRTDKINRSNDKVIYVVTEDLQKGWERLSDTSNSCKILENKNFSESNPWYHIHKINENAKDANKLTLGY